MQISDVLRHKAAGPAVTTVPGGTTIADALAVLAEHRVGALVVSADGVHVDGVFSERDVARGLHERGAALLDAPVSSVMTAEVHTCSPDARVLDLARLMTEHRVRHVPVVVGDRLAGIVSIGDVVKARLDELETEREQLVGYIQTS
ncbi:MAG: putative signal transduction protein with domain [Modestobacter sp.]|nr:putative signal transduction protein with domain [Modestobacter sp.]HEV7870914.1 CBS domain-containing protein [Modestobacter sp.]